MGKPFKKEIQSIPDTINWATNQSVKNLSDFLLHDSKIPLFIVGSGGSLSACYLVANLYQKNGTIAKAITPLELFYSKEALRDAKVLFISASGKNTDILFAFDIAIRQEPKSIAAVCMKLDAPLVGLVSKYSIGVPIEYDIPSKKDGFLATNSLVAYFTIFCRAFGHGPVKNHNKLVTTEYQKELKVFIHSLTSSHSLTVLFGGWGQSIAYDLESKFTEAALGNIILTDYRNFGHGRHHWFAKREKNSAIVAIVSPEERQIAEKTLSLIPGAIPKFLIRSHTDSAISSIELLVKSFELVSSFGELQKIDPGRPGVPAFGSKLYHLRYSSFYKLSSGEHNFDEELFITRKAQANSFSKLSEDEKSFWMRKYREFLRKLKDASFGTIIFDYDGTICSAENRLTGLTKEMGAELIRLLKQNITIGIATGRGRSVRDNLNKWIPENLRKNVIVGYYNGSDVGYLTNSNIPDKKAKTHKVLQLLNARIEELKVSIPSIDYELRPNQLSINFKSKESSQRLRELIRSILFKSEYSQVEMLESSHSVDIIVRPKVSKLNIINECIKRAKANKKSLDYLCIGDRGKWPGNDFELLACQYSLSVEEVSNDPETCWNLSSLGNKNSEATMEYLKRLSLKKGNLVFS